MCYMAFKIHISEISKISNNNIFILYCWFNIDYFFYIWNRKNDTWIG